MPPKNIYKVQYASNLFLSFKCPTKISPFALLKPSASTLILAGNCFRHNSPVNNAWLYYLSSCWKNVCIVPGMLEYSWFGLHSPVYLNECIDELKYEISTYTNIHYLSMKSINVDSMYISGTTMWPIELSTHKDCIVEYISHPYKIQTSSWKYEEEIWLDDIIKQYEYYLHPHMVITHNCMMSSKSLSYNSFNIYHKPVAAWITGANSNKSGLYGKTFMCSNSALSTGYYEGMTASIIH